MIAGLVTLTASCKDNSSAGAAATDETVATADSSESEKAAGAYYVMFKGDGS